MRLKILPPEPETSEITRQGPSLELDPASVPTIPANFGPELTAGLPFVATRLSVEKLVAIGRRLSEPVSLCNPEADSGSLSSVCLQAGEDRIDVDLAWILPRLAQDLLATEQCLSSAVLMLDT